MRCALASLLALREFPAGHAFLVVHRKGIVATVALVVLGLAALLEHRTAPTSSSMSSSLGAIWIAAPLGLLLGLGLRRGIHMAVDLATPWRVGYPHVALIGTSTTMLLTGWTYTPSQRPVYALAVALGLLLPIVQDFSDARAVRTRLLNRWRFENRMRERPFSELEHTAALYFVLSCGHALRRLLERERGRLSPMLVLVKCAWLLSRDHFEDALVTSLDPVARSSPLKPMLLILEAWARAGLGQREAAIAAARSAIEANSACLAANVSLAYLQVLGLPVVLGTAPPDEAGEASRRLEQALAIMAYRPIERLEHAVIARALGLTRSMLLVTNALVTLKAGDALSAEAILKGATWLEAPSSLLHLTFAEICVAQLELNPAAPEARTLRKRAHSHLWTVLWLERRRTRGLLRRRARALLRALVRRQRLALHPPAPPDTPAAGPTVFISYASEDRAFVKVLGDALAAAKIECCIDWQSSKFEPGLELLSVLGSAVDEGERVLFCASRNSLTKHHTDVELTLAFEKERELRMRGADGDIVIPLDLDGFMFQTEDRNPKRLLLTSRVVASFKGWQPGMDLPQAELARLVRAIQRTHRPDRP